MKTILYILTAALFTITNFSTVPSGFMKETSGGAYTIGANGEFIGAFTTGGYVRVTCTNITLKKGSEYWIATETLIPSGYFPNSSVSFRLITIDNWNQDTSTPTRIAIHIMRAGRLALLSNRGDTYKPLVETNFVFPLGRRVPVMLHVKLSDINGQALTEAYVDGKLVASSTKANIDASDIFKRIRVGWDGAAQARNKGGFVLYRFEAGPTR